MIKKYHDQAKLTGAVIIPEIGFESGVADMLNYTVCNEIRSKLSVGVRSVVATVEKIKSQPSGGTLSTALGLLDVFSISDLMAAAKPFALSPIPHTASAPSKPLSYTLLGTFQHPDLGQLTSWVSGGPDTAIVQRTWGLLDSGNYYGSSFTYSEHMSTSNVFTGLAVNIAIAVGMTALAFPPFRWLMKKLVFAPGEGPSKESTEGDHIELRAIGTAENGQKVEGRFKFKGSMYHLTAVMMMDGAMTLLRDRTRAREMGGGVLTPACLGDAYAERLKKSGVMLSAELR